MSCNRCADQATAAMTGAGVSANQVKQVWAHVFDSLGRCRKCGRFMSPRTMVCSGENCALAKAGKQQRPPVDPWPPEGVRFTTDLSRIGEPVAGEQAQVPPLPGFDAQDERHRIATMSGAQYDRHLVKQALKAADVGGEPDFRIDGDGDVRFLDFPTKEVLARVQGTDAWRMRQEGLVKVQMPEPDGRVVRAKVKMTEGVGRNRGNRYLHLTLKGVPVSTNMGFLPGWRRYRIRLDGEQGRWREVASDFRRPHPSIRHRDAVKQACESGLHPEHIQDEGRRRTYQANLENYGLVAAELQGASWLRERCEKCGAFVEAGGQCNNPLCPGKWQSPGIPGPENGWRWARPTDDRLPGDDLRRKYGIPLDATVEVGKNWHGEVATLQWYDPQKMGVFGCDNSEFLDPPDVRRARALLDMSDQSGFIQIDDDEWEQAHPRVINPLIDAPGVSLEEVESIEKTLQVPPDVEAEPYTFHEPRGWSRYEWWDVTAKEKIERDFLEMFPPGTLDAPRDFTRGSDDYHVGVRTPRQYAANHLGLWGIAGRGHHENAQRLAERCGVLLVGEGKCPLRPPGPDGNSEYLLDYRVDGSPVVAFALDLNKHHLYAWPSDGRDHKRGWGAMDQIVGRDEFRHNAQNWVIVRMRWGSGGTKRHDDVDLIFSKRPGEKEAQAAAETVATFLSRAGHDPRASICYDVGDQQVRAPISEMASGAQVEPATARISDMGREILSGVNEPYARWRSEGAVRDGSGRAGLAARELTTAAHRMRTALLGTSLPYGSELGQRINRFIEREREWRRDFRGMMTAFSLIKQELHLQLRRDREKANSRFGSGFVDLFAG